jgi:hypothetical protein
LKTPSSNQSSSEVPHRHERHDQADDHDDAEGEDQLHRLRQSRQAVPEVPVAGQNAQGRDGDEIEDAFHEDRAQRLRRRNRAVELEQVGAIEIAELGRDDAVHEPRQEQDLGAVPDADLVAGTPQELGPAPAPQREAGVVDREGEQHQPEIRLADVLRHVAQVLPVEQRRDDDDRDGDRDR